ncbi:hypothetical protein BZA05DRAFT_396644 [Tricharina praecox]|uniref:uncharacterized protein n=1 Tax=Tricharina praecox TaxID=43433 RepID=UPI00221E6A83|nr:uncharacterized protein BZA05DRAFT_396644 [Tricharina praecox]KAI5853609.1 hypothetical protein BZA05DRAFT_396644 [Tricharina praecox]
MPVVVVNVVLGQALSCPPGVHSPPRLMKSMVMCGEAMVRLLLRFGWTEARLISIASCSSSSNSSVGAPNPRSERVDTHAT